MHMLEASAMVILCGQFMRCHAVCPLCCRFSFHSMYIDMPTWSTKNIRALRDMDLHTFWGSSALRITAYSMPNESGILGQSAKLKQHLQAEIRYLFCIQVRFTISSCSE